MEAGVDGIYAEEDGKRRALRQHEINSLLLQRIHDAENDTAKLQEEIRKIQLKGTK